MTKSLTTDDLKDIARVVGKVVEEVVEEKLEEKLDEKLDEKLEPVMGMLTNIFDDLQGKHERIGNLDRRVTKLERIHPDNCHKSAVL